VTESELDAFAAAFQSCAIPKSEWTHQAHLKVGTWHVRRFGKDEALARLRIGIRRLNDSHGVPNSDTRGYHETITRVYVTLIDAFLRELPKDTSVDEVLNRLLSSRVGLRDFLLSFYSRERLMSTMARMEWVEPDIRSIQIDSIRRSSSAQRLRMPWKNGNGWTEELAVFPTSATMENFDWRVSIAGTDQSSAFSLFKDVDRSLALLCGRMALAVGVLPAVEIHPGGLPFSFSGDVQTSATLGEAPIIDLNVMTRRGRFRHSMERRELMPRSVLDLGSGVTLVFFIATRDVMIFEQPSNASTPELDGGDVYVVRIDVW
jgi:environmental stress-induced protein Ves